jgi:hypothetical protein
MPEAFGGKPPAPQASTRIISGDYNEAGSSEWNSAGGVALLIFAAMWEGSHVLP